jgi:hypothetical protein
MVVVTSYFSHQVWLQPILKPSFQHSYSDLLLIVSWGLSTFICDNLYNNQ